MNKVKSVILLVILLACFLLFTMTSYANTISEDLEKNFFRLHILANSNSEEDQNLKLKVRDNIIEYMNTLAFDSSSKSEAINIAKNHISDFQKIAEETIRDARK